MSAILPPLLSPPHTASRVRPAISKTLDDYMAIAYPLRLIPDQAGGYLFEYPDLPGCLGQIDVLDELAAHADEARRLWLETALELGKEIPMPSLRDDFSGKFIVRVPKWLHRQLVESAEAEGVSLNYYVGSLLAARQTAHALRAEDDDGTLGAIKTLQSVS